MSIAMQALLEQAKFMRPYLSASQIDVMFSNAARGEEKEYFRKLITNLVGHVMTAPVTYQQDGVKDPMAHFHYFNGGSDWYITELDMDGGVRQAFGYTILNGDMQNAELGYISITELVKHGCELDLNYEPTPLSVIKNKLDSSDNVEASLTYM